MKQYKVTFLRIGHACISAESKEQAAQLAENLDDSAIHWLGIEDGLSGTHLVTLVEENGKEDETHGK